jgi:hypothetical protein
MAYMLGPNPSEPTEILSLYCHLSLPSPSSTTFYLGPYDQPHTYRIEESEIYDVGGDNDALNIDDYA